MTYDYENRIWYVTLTLWLVAQALEVKVLPAKSVPPVDVLNKPMFDRFELCVKNEAEEANAAVNWTVFDAMVEGETVLRWVDDMISPASDPIFLRAGIFFNAYNPLP